MNTDGLKKAIDEELLNFFVLKNKQFNENIIKKIKDFTMHGGKRIRPLLMCYGYMAGGKKINKNIIRASCSLELIHSSLLIHDDIIDQDDIRRSTDTVWNIFSKEKNNKHFGFSQGIVSGDLALSLALDCFLSTNIPDLLKIKTINQLVLMLNHVNIGQFLDVNIQFSSILKKEEILKVYEYKTAKYTIEAPLILGAIMSGAGNGLQRILTNYAVPVGIAYQIIDDILGIFGQESSLGKPIGSDVREGKKTLLILKALEKGNLKEKKIILKNLGNKNLTKKEFEVFKNILVKTGSLKYSSQLSRKLITKAKKELKTATFPKNVKLYLNELADFIINRSF